MIPNTRTVRSASRKNPRSRRPRSWTFWWLLAGLASASCGAAQAAVPRVLPPGQLPEDHRLAPPKDLDGYFPFTPSASPGEWSKRAEQVRRQIQVALGLWPMPTKTPLNPVIHGKVDRDTYTVEKVYFESVPGFFVTGNLYRPKGKTGRLPAVLSPHGHWDNGRFLEFGDERIRREIVQGGERFEEGGRSPLQSRCVQLARMGCVVFHYDMLGYADSRQISMEIAHGFAKQRPEMNTTSNWGLFSPQAEAHLQSIMGLQTWNSIRALDFLTSLPDVDSSRVGVTGASGGGTQTFLLCALDPRPSVAFPAVMVSTAMQGGCTCENASLLRVDTGNVEFAALFAPKPLGMTAANDWTKEMATKGFPELKQHFAMMGAPGNVMLKPLIHFDHNYNYVSRAAMYSWMNQHLKLGWPEPVVEEDYKRLTKAEMSVWDDAHPAPSGGPDFERELLRWLTADTEKQIQQASASIEEYRRLAVPALEVLIGRTLAQAGTVQWTENAQTDGGDFWLTSGRLRNASYDEELPLLVLRPKQATDQTVICVTETGKAGLFTAGADSSALRPSSIVRRFLDSGATVIGVDLLYQGEFLANGQPLSQTPRVKNPREAGPYTFGYNRAVFAQRVHDILSVIRFAQSQRSSAQRIHLAGLDSSGPWIAAARALAGGAIDRTAIQAGGFRFGRVLDLRDPSFLPGGAKYGDLPGLLALTAPGKLWVIGESQPLPEIVQTAYAGANQSALVLSPDSRPETAAAWLVSKNE